MAGPLSGVSRFFTRRSDAEAASEGEGESEARLAAMAQAQARRADAAQAALEAVRTRLDALEVELYVARSEQQRSAVEADDLRRELDALKRGSGQG